MASKGHTCAAVHHSRPRLPDFELLHSAHKVPQGLRCGGDAMVWPGVVVKMHHLARWPCTSTTQHLLLSRIALLTDHERQLSTNLLLLRRGKQEHIDTAKIGCMVKVQNTLHLPKMEVHCRAGWPCACGTQLFKPFSLSMSTSGKKTLLKT